VETVKETAGQGPGSFVKKECRNKCMVFLRVCYDEGRYEIKMLFIPNRKSSGSSVDDL